MTTKEYELPKIPEDIRVLCRKMRSRSAQISRALEHGTFHPQSIVFAVNIIEVEESSTFTYEELVKVRNWFEKVDHDRRRHVRIRELIHQLKRMSFTAEDIKEVVDEVFEPG